MYLDSLGWMRVRKDKLGRRVLRSRAPWHNYTHTKVFRVITSYQCYCINLYNNHKDNNVIDIVYTNYTLKFKKRPLKKSFILKIIIIYLYVY